MAEIWKNDVLEARQLQENPDQQDAKRLGSEICDNAKKISPESNRGGELDAKNKDYATKIDAIEAQFGKGESKEKNNALQVVTQEYIDEINTAVGTTEWAEAKLIKDGEKAIKEASKAEGKSATDWKEALKKFSAELKERADIKQKEITEKAKQQWIKAQNEWNQESRGSQTEALASLPNQDSIYPA